MGPTTRRWITVIGVVGHLARMVAFGLIGIFVFRAAIDYAPRRRSGWTARSRSSRTRATARCCSAVVAAGLVAFGLYSIADARYRRI